MLAVRFRIRNTNGLLTFCQKSLRLHLFRPCDKKFDPKYSRVFSFTSQKYSECTDENQPDLLKRVAAFSAFAPGSRQKKPICARFIMGILIEPWNAPSSGEVVGLCYRYSTREQVRIYTENHTRWNRNHRIGQAGSKGHSE